MAHEFKKGDVCRYLGNPGGIATSFDVGEIVTVTKPPLYKGDTINAQGGPMNVEQGFYPQQVKFLRRKIPEKGDFIGTEKYLIRIDKADYRHNRFVLEGSMINMSTKYYINIGYIEDDDYTECLPEERDLLVASILAGKYTEPIPVVPENKLTVLPEKGWCHDASDLFGEYLAKHYTQLIKKPGSHGYIWNSSGYAPANMRSAYPEFAWKDLYPLVEEDLKPEVDKAVGDPMSYDYATLDQTGKVYIGGTDTIDDVVDKYDAQGERILRLHDVVRVVCNDSCHSFEIGQHVWIKKLPNHRYANAYYGCAAIGTTSPEYSLLKKEFEYIDNVKDLDDLDNMPSGTYTINHVDNGPIPAPTNNAEVAKNFLDKINIFKKKDLATEVADRSVKPIPHTTRIKGIDKSLEIPLKIPKNR